MTTYASYPTYSTSSWQEPSTAMVPFEESYAYGGNNTSSRAASSSSLVHKKQTPAEIQTMKTRRKRRTVASGVAGGIIGLVALGPVGGLAGGIGSAVVAKKIGKRNEKKRMDQLEAQQNPLRSNGSGEML